MLLRYALIQFHSIEYWKIYSIYELIVIKYIFHIFDLTLSIYGGFLGNRYGHDSQVIKLRASNEKITRILLCKNK
jgi:hypothetical protein